VCYDLAIKSITHELQGGFTSMSKRKLTYLQKKQLENQVNKKAIVWISSITVTFILTIVVLVIINN
jgi:hypothetical protein